MKITHSALIIVLGITFIFISCKEKLKNSKSEIVASIGMMDSINLSEIDNLSKQELFDELNRIYIIRKTALELLLKNKVINIEANKHKLSSEQFLNKYYIKNINESSLIRFIQNNHLTEGIPELKRTFRYVDINSKEGKELLTVAMKKYLKQRLVDSLFKAFDVKIKLNPPNPISFGIDKKIHVRYRGNLLSKISIIEISDFECESCRKTFPMMKDIYNKYKDKVKFGFSNFASYTTLCAIASECAAKQNKFWEMHDLITEMKDLPDTTDLINLAQKINLNIDEFKKDLNSKSIKDELNSNFEIIKAIGIYGTPTFLINGKAVFNSFSKEEIEKILESELIKN